MKILLYTNTPCLYRQNSAYNGGGWLTSLQAMLMQRKEVELGIAFALDGEPEKVVEDRVTYYPLRMPKASPMEKVKGIVCPVATLAAAERKRYPLYEQVLKRPIDDFQPDVIMVFGSELPFGLVAGITSIPVVLHIQGVLNPYLNAYLPPFVSWKDYEIRGGQNGGVKARLRKLFEHKKWLVACEREKEILKRTENYFGRTDWDFRVTQMMHPGAGYRYASEVLRPVFYEPVERQLPERLTVVTTISSPLYKGFDLVLKTARMLREGGVDFCWKCYGNIDPSVVERQLGIRHDEVGVELCGVATPEELRDAICRATVYVHTSYIDNSPNSLCEAQILGCPVVATYVGGIPSLIKDGETGYLVPANDPYQLALLLKELHADPGLGEKMGREAQRVARERHDPEAIVSKLLGDLTDLCRNTRFFGSATYRSPMRC